MGMGMGMGCGIKDGPSFWPLDIVWSIVRPVRPQPYGRTGRTI